MVEGGVVAFRFKSQDPQCMRVTYNLNERKERGKHYLQLSQEADECQTMKASQHHLQGEAKTERH